MQAQTETIYRVHPWLAWIHAIGERLPIAGMTRRNKRQVGAVDASNRGPRKVPRGEVLRQIGVGHPVF